MNKIDLVQVNSKICQTKNLKDTTDRIDDKNPVP